MMGEERERESWFRKAVEGREVCSDSPSLEQSGRSDWRYLERAGGGRCVYVMSSVGVLC
jgi:hypothetical protein